MRTIRQEGTTLSAISVKTYDTFDLGCLTKIQQSQKERSTENGGLARYAARGLVDKIHPLHIKAHLAEWYAMKHHRGGRNSEFWKVVSIRASMDTSEVQDYLRELSHIIERLRAALGDNEAGTLIQRKIQEYPWIT